MSLIFFATAALRVVYHNLDGYEIANGVVVRCYSRSHNGMEHLLRKRVSYFSAPLCFVLVNKN